MKNRFFFSCFKNNKLNGFILFEIFLEMLNCGIKFDLYYVGIYSFLLVNMLIEGFIWIKLGLLIKLIVRFNMSFYIVVLYVLLVLGKLLILNIMLLYIII